MLRSRIAPDVPFPARYYAGLLPWLEGQAALWPRLARRHALQPADLLAAGRRIDAVAVETLVGAALAASGRDDLGLVVGKSILPSSHEVLGHAFLASATLGQALELAARYWSLLAPAFALAPRVDGRVVRIGIRPALALSAPVLEFHRQAIAVAFCTEVEFLVGGTPRGAAVELPPMSTRQRAAYRLALGWRLLPKAGPDLAFVLPLALLERRRALADDTALAAARGRCEQALARSVRSGGLAALAGSLLVGEPADWPRQPDLAELLHLSSRSLSRKLAAEGASLRRLGVDARIALARERLRDPDASVTRIALDLGYSDAANFARAFRREQGCSPSEFRRRAYLQLRANRGAGR